MLDNLLVERLKKQKTSLALFVPNLASNNEFLHMYPKTFYISILFNYY